jgi:hypothetical protein
LNLFRDPLGVGFLPWRQMMWGGTALELILGKGTAADSGAPLRSNITHRRLDSRSMGEFGITIDKWDDPPGNFVFWWVFHGFPVLLFTILVSFIFILLPNCVSKAPELQNHF